MVSCGALCASVVGYGMIGNKDVSGNLAYQVGYNLLIAIILAGGLHFIFRKRERASTGGLGFVVIFTASLVAQYIAVQRFRSDVRQSVVQIQENLAALQDATSSGKAAPVPMAITGVGSSEGAKVAVLLQTNFNRVLSRRREYEREFEAIGWSTILDGRRLKSDATLSESRSMLQQARTIVAKYKSGNDAMFASMREEIERSNLSESSRRSMLGGFDRSVEKAKARAMEMYTLEEEMLEEFGKIFDYLSEKRKVWHIERGLIHFGSESDLERYHAHIERLQFLVAKQDRMRAANIQHAHGVFNQLIE